MPIRPENKARYPKNWREISQRIRFLRAKGRCEFREGRRRCKAVHGEPHPMTGSKVVLTVAHLDHTPEHNGDDNLMAMCQRCHNRYDREYRSATRKRTRAASNQRQLGNGS